MMTKPKTGKCCNCKRTTELVTKDECQECYDYLMEMQQEEMQREENRWITVTKEMASDACDPSLEGQKWYW